MYVGMTMLLAVSVFQMTINDILPVTSDTIPLIGKSQYLCIDIGLNLHYTELNPYPHDAMLARSLPPVCLCVCLFVRPSVRPSVRHTQYVLGTKFLY